MDWMSRETEDTLSDLQKRLLRAQEIRYWGGGCSQFQEIRYRVTVLGASSGTLGHGSADKAQGHIFRNIKGAMRGMVL